MDEAAIYHVTTGFPVWSSAVFLLVTAFQVSRGRRWPRRAGAATAPCMPLTQYVKDAYMQDDAVPQWFCWAILSPNLFCCTLREHGVALCDYWLQDCLD